MKRSSLLIVPFVVLAFYAHWVGLSRGLSDYVPPGREAAAFYHFHPDEETLVRAALALENPLKPPLTAYGALPVYLLKAVLLGHEGADLDAASTAAQIFRKARLLAVFVSFANLLLLYFLAVRLVGHTAALWAVLLLAFSPLAIQQAHFYTVDGVFTLLSLAMLWALLRAVRADSLRAYAPAAILVGCAGAVRLNGLLLGAILVAAYFFHVREVNLRRLVLPVLCGLLALVVLAILQPYLVADPSLLWRDHSHGDFAFSLGIAKGDVLQTWTLLDVHTIAYWHHLTALLPLAMGWPLALVGAVSAVYVGWKGSGEKRLLLAWCALYFLLIGSLHTKPIRYLFPLLPLLALFAADFCRSVFSRRKQALVFNALLASCTIVQGLFFAQIYAGEDPRISAARWLAHAVPTDAKIGLEKGAFTLHKLIDGQRTADLNILHLFYTGPYMLCAQRVDYVQGRAEKLDYIAVITANRHRQFTAVPELYPVVADFYGRLLAGKMGYREVAHFENRASFFDEQIDPSFTGYDHPTVLVFQREANFAAVFAGWRRDIATHPHCGDGGFERLAAALREGDLPAARTLANRATEALSPRPLYYLLASETYRRLGEPADMRNAELRYAYPRGRWAHLRKAPTVHRVPAASAMSLVDLGLTDLALAVLKEGIGDSVFYPFGAMSDMADTYIAVAQRLLMRQELDPMQEVLALSMQLYEKPAAYNTLARVAYFSHDYARAQSLWQRSLVLDPVQEKVRANLAELAELAERRAE